MASIKKKPMGYHYVVYLNGVHYNHWDSKNDSEMMRGIASHFTSTGRRYYYGPEGLKLQIERYPYYDRVEQFGESDKHFIMHVKPTMVWGVGSAKWWSVNKSGKKGAVHTINITND